MAPGTMAPPPSKMAPTLVTPTTSPIPTIEVEVIRTILEFVTNKELTPAQKEKYERALEAAFTKGLGKDLTAREITVHISSMNMTSTANVSITSEVSNGLIKKLNLLLIGNEKDLFKKTVDEQVMKENLDAITFTVTVAPTRDG